MNEKITIDDLVDWIDRPPSNEDLTVCKYIANRINNWNELKKCIEQWMDYHSVCDKDYKALNVLEDVKSKMQELEQGKDE